MKKALFALAIGAAFCVSAAELAMDPQTPWKKTAEGYSIDYSGSGWTSLAKKVFVEGGKFYRNFRKSRLFLLRTERIHTAAFPLRMHGRLRRLTTMRKRTRNFSCALRWIPARAEKALSAIPHGMS